MENYNKIIVKKPWGYEYLAYENEDVGLWILHINKDHSTSMHCHPLKNTGLILLDGKAEISFFNNSYEIKKRDKMMIRKGLFHKTRAITDCILLEIETPKDKEDLVRLEDNYGRENKVYETKEHFVPKLADSLSLSVDKEYIFFENLITVRKINSTEDFLNEEFDNCVVLSGGLFAEKDKCVLNPGDVINKDTLLKLKKFSINNNTVFMFIKNAN